MLYYLPEPLQAVQRYARALAPGGRIIVSMWLGSPRAVGILRQLREALPFVDETLVGHLGHQWKLHRPLFGAAGGLNAGTAYPVPRQLVESRDPRSTC